MCGEVQGDLLSGKQWKAIKDKLKAAGINLKKEIPCSNDRLLFYKSIVNMSVEDIKKRFNSC